MFVAWWSIVVASNTCFSRNANFPYYTYPERVWLAVLFLFSFPGAKVLGFHPILCRYVQSEPRAKRLALQPAKPVDAQRQSLHPLIRWRGRNSAFYKDSWMGCDPEILPKKRGSLLPGTESDAAISLHFEAPKALRSFGGSKLDQKYDIMDITKRFQLRICQT